MKIVMRAGTVLALAMMVGCSELVNVSGVVELDGKPLDHGSITFIPKEGGGMPAVAPIVTGGKFRMVSHNEQGAMRGKYKVVISSRRGGKEILPPRYSDPHETELELTVPAAGDENLIFELSTGDG